MESRALRIALVGWTIATVFFLLAPIVLIGVYAFNASSVEGWPITELSTRWFGDTWRNTEIRDALWLSVRVGLASTVIALLLGSAAAFAVQRFRFFGSEAISFLVVLPIALPGIITGMALNSFVVNAPGFLFPSFLFSEGRFSLPTIVIGHATFCIVIVYNNVLARLRRTPGSLTEASMDLGADGWQTFRFITWPALSTALVAGALLAFALSFDEVIVTYFTAGAQNTLPLWILGAIRQGTSLPQVNVVVLFWILLSLIPVAASVRLARDTGAFGR
jgi:putative spermidine/putrescine transport system permease protein